MTGIWTGSAPSGIGIGVGRTRGGMAPRDGIPPGGIAPGGIAPGGITPGGIMDRCGMAPGIIPGGGIMESGGPPCIAPGFISPPGIFGLAGPKLVSVISIGAKGFHRALMRTMIFWRSGVGVCSSATTVEKKPEAFSFERKSSA